MKRRGFIRTVIAGGAGVAMTGLPFERVYAEPPHGSSGIRTNRRHIVREPAHMIRDGHQFPLPPPTEFVERPLAYIRQSAKVGCLLRIIQSKDLSVSSRSISPRS